MEKTSITRKLLALALCLVVAVTFIPLFGDGVYATDEEGQVNPSEEVTNDVVVEEPSVVEQPPAEVPDGNDTDITSDNPTEDVVENEDENAADTEVKAAEAAEGAFEVSGPMSFDALEGAVFTAKASNLTTFNCQYTNLYGGIVRVNASIASPSYITKVIVNNKTYKSYSNQPKSITVDVDVRNYSPSYCPIQIGYYKSGNYTSGAIYVPVSIYYTPSAGTISGVYHNYLDYFYPADYRMTNSYPSGHGVFIDVSPNGGASWTGTYGPIGAVQSKQLTGLASNTYYTLRSYYAVAVYNPTDGKYYLAQGTDTGNVLNLGTYRTGVGSTVAVKSIKVKAYKVKKKKQRVYGYYTGLYLGSTKYYKYKLKIIIKLKKKPDTPYIWINGKTYKGNKKKYTVNLGSFTSYSKPKGKKYTVAIYKFFDGSYGGYSPMYTKVKKIK